MVTLPLFGRFAPVIMPTRVDLPQPDSPTMAYIPFVPNSADTSFNTSRLASYEKVVCSSLISVPSTFSLPQTGSGSSRRAIIFFPAVAPFIATWKALPKARRGRKKSTAMSIKNRERIGFPPFTAPFMAKAMPMPAPPKATKSIIVTLESCITRTFIVMRRNSSAFSLI